MAVIVFVGHIAQWIAQYDPQRANVQTLPPRPNLANAALRGNHTATLTDTYWHACLSLGAKPSAATARATHTQILDIVGTPELRGDKQL